MTFRGHWGRRHVAQAELTLQISHREHDSTGPFQETGGRQQKKMNVEIKNERRRGTSTC